MDFGRPCSIGLFVEMPLRRQLAVREHPQKLERPDPVALRHREDVPRRIHRRNAAAAR